MELPVVKVLMVDDDEEEFTVVNKYLKRATAVKYSVYWIPSFEEALQAVVDSDHEICLLDYQLGEHTGIELLQEMRNRGSNRPVILLTGQGNIEIDRQAMELGAFDYLEKSELNPALLERSIRYAIENHRVREALREANEELEHRVQERTAELHRSNLELEQFAQIVAHDLQQPLEALAKHIADLEAGVSRGEALDTTVGSLEAVFLAVRNMDLLVQLVLDYSRTRKQRKPFDDVDLRQVVDEVRVELAHRIEKGGATVDIGDLPTVKADRRLMKGVFENLLGNALKYRSDAPLEVRIAATQRGDTWLCTVRDNGLGVAEEDADEIFMMFARGTHGEGRAGVGIGLALCRKIIEYHSGHIWVDSGLEGGSTFLFTLPAE